MPSPAVAIGTRASSPAEEKARVPGTANNRAYGAKRVRAGKSASRASWPQASAGVPAGPSGGSATVTALGRHTESRRVLDILEASWINL
ncbi:hypothetical protein GCM10028783_19890 [Modestobacter muralis]